MPDNVSNEVEDHTIWLSRLQALPRGATVLVIGGADTGKSAWTRLMVTSLAQSGLSIAVVDCDIGQGEISPPGTVGAAWASSGGSYRSLRDLAPLASYFVGVTTPVHCLLDVCVGAVQMARVAKKRRPDLLFIDTDGFITGASARLYKRRLAELTLPSVLVAFTRGSELAPLLTAFAHLETPEVWRLPVSEAVQRKTTASRTTRRAARFLAALDGSESQTLSLDEAALQGTWLGAGQALPHHHLQYLSECLLRPVLHAEQSAGGLYIVVQDERWAMTGMSAIENYFRTSHVTIVAAQKFAHLLVGLVSKSGILLSLGIIERIEFAKRTLTILTPCRKPRAIAQVWFGGLRLRPDGREIGRIRPGEI